MKSQHNYLENDIESLEKRLDEDNLSETEKSQVLDELASRKLQREEICKHKTKGAISGYDRKPIGTTMGKIRNISLILKNDTLRKKTVKSFQLS